MNSKKLVVTCCFLAVTLPLLIAAPCMAATALFNLEGTDQANLRLTAISGPQGPDWGSLFNADGSLRDLVNRFGAVRPNGIPDVIDLGGRGAAFIPAQRSLGNSYVYMKSSGKGQLMLYIGLERLAAEPDSTVGFELNQGATGARSLDDLMIRIYYGTDGALGGVEVSKWAFGRTSLSAHWAPAAMLVGPGCSDEGSLCALGNSNSIQREIWKSYDPAGKVVDKLAPNTFTLLGINAGELLGRDVLLLRAQIRNATDSAIAQILAKGSGTRIDEKAAVRGRARTVEQSGQVTLSTVEPTPLALSGNDPSQVSFTLEGCRNDGAIILPIGGRFVCPDSAYTTGNLGKGWNELDLVPFRITASAGNSAPAAQTYDVGIALDNFDAGHPGYDVIASDGVKPPGAPVLNAALSSAGCTALTSTGQLSVTPGVGGIDTTIYQILTITQAKNTLCVYDWYGRLALGSHLFPGSSLHADLLNRSLTTSGIGSKDVSIPVKEISPQEIAKDMSASQGSDHTWDITKSPTPASLNFPNTCDPEQPLDQGVTLSITWEKLAAVPNGPITVITHVYATNPAARAITTEVIDNVYRGTTQANLLCTKSSSVDVPANTSNYLVLTNTCLDNVAADAQFNDVAAATYTDAATGQPVVGNTQATASATVQPTGPELDTTATISDSESITGAGMTFSADSVTGAGGAFGGGYTPGTHTVGPVSWTSATQSGNGSVTFGKTVYIAGPEVATGALTDTSILNGSSGFTKSADATVNISTNYVASITIVKTIPDGSISAPVTFTFEVLGTGKTASINFTPGGSLSNSATVTGLSPGSYTVREGPTPGWNTQPDFGPIDLRGGKCSGTATFDNTLNLQVFSLLVTKNCPAKSKAGDVVTYTVTIQNTSDAGTTDLIFDSFSDSLAGGVTPPAACNTLAPGASCNFTYNYTVKNSDPDPLVNTATATYHPTGIVTSVTNSNNCTVNLFQPSVTVTKTGPANSKIGDTITYNVTIHNTSSNDAPDLVLDSFADTLVPSVTPPAACSPLASGAGCNFTYTHVVVAADPSPLNNTATVHYHPTGFTNDITSSSSWAVGLFQPSVKITKTGPAYSKTGDTATFHVTIENTGSANSPNLVLDSFTDSVVPSVTPPASCNPLAPGASCSFSYTHLVTAGDPDPLVNTATAHYHPTGFANDITSSSTWSTDLLHPSFTVSKACKISLVKYTDPAPFTITFHNTGDADLHVVPNEGSAFDVTAGSSFSYDYSVPNPGEFTTNVNNTVTGTATLAAKYALSNSYDFTASGTCIVAGGAKVIKTVGGQSPAAGQTFTFELRQGASTLSDGTVLETKNTDASGNIEFSATLTPGQTYQLCEWVFPGWSTNLTGDGPLFVPNSIVPPNLPNPNANNLTVCVNFSVTDAQQRTFTVNNSPPPGGRALTIGFWKNWASCAKSRGNQAHTLDQTLAIAATDAAGGLVASAQNAGSGFPNFAPLDYLVLHSNDCQAAVNLLNKSTILTGKKMASDPLFNLAAQLVGAELNLFAGASMNGSTLLNLTRSVMLNGYYHFNGNTYTPQMSGPDRELANCLATQLDNYNNNMPVSTCP